MLLLSLLRGCVMYIASVLLLCRPISSAQGRQHTVREHACKHLTHCAERAGWQGPF
jgi:hypothetical protein